MRFLRYRCLFFFFNDTATTEIYTLSLHDALPISSAPRSSCGRRGIPRTPRKPKRRRSEEHTSELQSQFHIVCRLLLEKKKKCSDVMHPKLYQIKTNGQLFSKV